MTHYNLKNGRISKFPWKPLYKDKIRLFSPSIPILVVNQLKSYAISSSMLNVLITHSVNNKLPLPGNIKHLRATLYSNASGSLQPTYSVSDWMCLAWLDICVSLSARHYLFEDKCESIGSWGILCEGMEYLCTQHCW